jgi:hypothetical protein
MNFFDQSDSYYNSNTGWYADYHLLEAVDDKTLYHLCQLNKELYQTCQTIPWLKQRIDRYRYYLQQYYAYKYIDVIDPELNQDVVSYIRHFI